MPLTGLPALAAAGTDTVVVTSASAEIAVVALAESGAVFAPSSVVVAIVQATVTAPEAGAVNASPKLMLAPAPRSVGMPVNVTTPDPAL